MRILSVVQAVCGCAALFLCCVSATSQMCVNPVLLGSFDTPGYTLKVTIEGTTAYVADNASGLQIVDVTDPANASLIG